MSKRSASAAGRTLAPREAAMSLAELLELPVAVDIVTAGRAWGFGRTKAQAMAKAGTFPCPVLRLGAAYRVTRADLLRSLGINPDMSEGAPDKAPITNTIPTKDPHEGTAVAPQLRAVRPTG